MQSFALFQSFYDLEEGVTNLWNRPEPCASCSGSKFIKANTFRYKCCLFVQNKIIPYLLYMLWMIIGYADLFKEEGFTPYGQSRDFYLGRVIYSQFTWFGVCRWGMRTPLISDCGQRCEVTAWGGWNFVVKQRLDKEKKTAIFPMQNLT